MRLNPMPLRVLIPWLMLLFCMRAFGWSEPHQSITKAALRVLPDSDREALAAEWELLGEDFCLIPDHVFTDRKNARYAMMDSRPGETYLTVLHLPSKPEEYQEVLGYFIEKAAGALREGRGGDAARFTGTICHLIEDYGSPSHTIPGDNMFTLQQQFLPPPAHMRHKLLHGLIESGSLEVSIEGYQARVLGTSVAEAAWRLTHRIHDAIVNARGTTVPIIQALYQGDTAAVTRHQQIAAKVDAEVVADAIHTVIALGLNRFPVGVEEVPRRIGLDSFFPLEAPNLYYPQKMFFGAPYWGHPSHGYVLENGEREVPLKLFVAENESVMERVFREGIGAGGRSTLTYQLPAGVFRKFDVLVGLHSELGANGAAEFSILLDGKKAASVQLKGGDSAVRLECDLEGVAQLQLVSAGQGTNPKSNYTVWAEPVLSK